MLIRLQSGILLHVVSTSDLILGVLCWNPRAINLETCDTSEIRSIAIHAIIVLSPKSIGCTSRTCGRGGFASCASAAIAAAAIAIWCHLDYRLARKSGRSLLTTVRQLQPMGSIGMKESGMLNLVDTLSYHSICTVKLFSFFFCANFDVIFNFADFATITFDIDLAV